MSRTLTNRNEAHPHNRIKAFQQSIKEQYRQRTTEDLDRLVNHAYRELPQFIPAELKDAPHPVLRKAKLEFLIAHAAQQFKAEWETRYGWPFDDCYDDDKLRAHVRAIVEAGFGGCMPNGMIVDRRVVPDALPMPQNHFLGIGKQKPLPTGEGVPLDTPPRFDEDLDWVKPTPDDDTK